MLHFNFPFLKMVTAEVQTSLSYWEKPSSCHRSLFRTSFTIILIRSLLWENNEWKKALKYNKKTENL